jgi:general secretion pathway protein L
LGIFHTGFGIDLRQNHLILTLLKKSLGKIRVVDSALHLIPPEEQKEEREAQVIGLINGFVLKHRIKRDCVSISIPREKAVIRFFRLPVSTKENLRKVLEYETPRYTPFEKEEVYLDYHLLREEKEWLSLMAVYAKRSDIDPYLSLLKKVGIKPLSIQIPSIAALNLFSYHRRGEENEISVLLDVSKPYFEMNLIEGSDWRESLHLPMPSEEKTSDLMGILKRLGLEPSSFAKTTFFVYGLDADETILAPLKEADGIKGVSPPPISRMKIAGELARSSRIYPSLGVPLREMVKPRIDLNLLPPEMRKKVRQIGKPLSILFISLAVMISLTWGMRVFFKYQDKLASVTEEIRKRKPEVEAVEKLQKQQEVYGKEISELEKIQSEEISKVEMLKELTRLLPPAVWIWNMKYNGKEIEISGFADSASDLISLLDKSPLFDKVEFLAPVTKERQIKPEGAQEKERFKIRAKIEARRKGS